MSKWFRVYGFADVHDRLLVGAYPLDRDDVSMLEWMKIEHVLNLVEDEEYEPGERNKVEQALYAAGIQEHRLSLTDYGRLPAPKVELAVAEINQWLDQGHRVYVHCRAGWQRSAAIAAGVVALREGVDIEDALARVRRRKPSADPLPQQREDLLRWWADREPGRTDHVGEPRSGAVDETTTASGRTAAPVDETTTASGRTAAPVDETTTDDGRTATPVDGRTAAPVDETTAAGGRTAAPVDETEEVLKWLAEHDPARRKPGGGDDR